jgi:hypothetical protein
MTEKYHDELVKLYKNTTKTEQHKNYDSDDKCVGSKGTKFEGKEVGKYSYVNVSTWPKTEETRKGVFTKHRYENRIKASDVSLFNLSQITDEEADTLGLFHYPEDIDKYKCPVFLGGDISEKSQDMFNRLNAKYGPSKQFRLWVLVFENKPMSIAYQQENYWVKGNKNELVICIGINNKKEIEWSHSFSWANSNILTAETESKVLDMYEYTIETKSGMKLPAAIPLNTKLKENISSVTGIDTAYLPPVIPIKNLGISQDDITKVVKSSSPVLNDRTLEEYYKYLDKNLKKFQRRSFSDFFYLKVEPKRKHIILIYILSFVVSLGLNLFFVSNDIRNDDDDDKYKHHYRRY